MALFPVYGLCVRVVADGAHVLQGLVERDHIGVLGVEIEQTLLMGRGRAVADRLAHHHGSQPRLHGINRCGAHAAAGGAADDDHGVDAPISSRDTRSVPKKHEANFFTSRLSVLRKSSRGSICTPSLSAFSVTTPFCLSAQIPASLRSASL